MRALVLLCCAPALAHSQSAGTAELLAKVAKTYESMAGWVVDIERYESSDTTMDVAAARGGGGYIGRRSSSQYAVAVALPDQLRYEVKGRVVVIADGETLWTYRPDLREYTARPQPVDMYPMRDKLSPFFMHFARIAMYAAQSAILKSRRCKSGKSNVECVGVRIQPSGEPWREDVWIDPETGLVLEIQREFPGAIDLQATTSDHVRYAYVSSGVPADASLFTWSAPKGSVQVQKFRQDRGASFPPPQIPFDPQR